MGGLQFESRIAMTENEKPDFSVLEQADIPGVAYSPGETIIAEGTPATEMYLVRKGRASIEVNGKTIEEIGRGAIFGEMALIANSARTAAVVAIDNCEVIPRRSAAISDSCSGYAEFRARSHANPDATLAQHEPVRLTAVATRIAERCVAIALSNPAPARFVADPAV
jgi:CRP-like cAMP-binding protein